MIKVSELAYCRLQVPDLDKSDEFLLDFGLLPAGREPARRFYRGTDDIPYCYIVEEGPEHFLGCAFQAKSLADLQSLSSQTGVPIEEIDAPGGGKRVRLTEPNGYAIDVVYGIAPSQPIEVKRQSYNSGAAPLQRKGELYRLSKGPTPIRRLAHVVMATPLIDETTNWLHDVLGMITSDRVEAGPDKTHIGSFVRVDDGDNYVDHHSFFVVSSPETGLQHVSFEAQDIDAVFADHHYLKGLGRYEHMWGIGRHLLGSQVFDYWSDPYGYPHEHWADSDRLNATAATNIWDARDGLVTQWGEEPSERFRKAVKP